MGKFRKILSALFCVGLLLSGCSSARQPEVTEPTVRTVERIEVICRQEQQTLLRSYTEPEKMEAVLYYLRLLKPLGAADTDPERLEGTVYRITLHFTDAQQRIYHLRADRYLSRDSNPWQRVDPEKAARLYALVQYYPSD